MKTMTRLMLFLAVMLMVAAPVFSGEASQSWRCEMEEGVTEAEVIAAADEWLKAAKQVEGGKRFRAYVHFPVAVNATGEVDTLFVVVAPTFAEWGKFWDNYPDSPAADVEEKNKAVVACPDSGLWEAFVVN